MRSRRILTLLAVSILGLFSHAALAQGSTPTQGGTIVIAVANNPVGLDPQKSAAGSTLAVTQLIYSSLLKYDGEMNLIGDLAESYSVVAVVACAYILRNDVA